MAHSTNQTDGFYIVALPAVSEPWSETSPGRAWLVKGGEALKHTATGAVVLDLNRAFDLFTRVYRDPSATFITADVATIAVLKPATIGAWIADRVVLPTEPGARGKGQSARFDFWGCFAVGCLATLARRGVGKPLLRRVFRLIVTAGRSGAEFPGGVSRGELKKAEEVQV